MRTLLIILVFVFCLMTIGCKKEKENHDIDQIDKTNEVDEEAILKDKSFYDLKYLYKIGLIKNKDIKNIYNLWIKVDVLIEHLDVDSENLIKEEYLYFLKKDNTSSRNMSPESIQIESYFKPSEGIYVLIISLSDDCMIQNKSEIIGQYTFNFTSRFIIVLCDKSIVNQYDYIYQMAQQVKGPMYTLEEAYKKRILVEEDLEQIYKIWADQIQLNELLDKEIESKIKTYLTRKLIDNEENKDDFGRVQIVKYLGQYNNVYVVVTKDDLQYPSVIVSEKVGEYNFERDYSNFIRVWCEE